MYLTADPGVASSIPERSHTFAEIEHEIISTFIFLLPLILSVTSESIHVHEILVNCLVKLAQEKSVVTLRTKPSKKIVKISSCKISLL